MKKLRSLLSLTLLGTSFAATSSAQMAAAPDFPQTRGPGLSVDLLSDTHGADLGPYLHDLLATMNKRWQANEPADHASTQPQEVLLDLTIDPAGKLSAMRLGRSSTDTALDRAAWGAAEEATYSPLPSGMHSEALKLRVHFRTR